MAKSKAIKNEQQAEGFWSKYKLYIIGFVGAILLICTLSIQSVSLCFVTEKGEKYAVKLDYNVFGICQRCNATTDNAHDIVEKDTFFMGGMESTVEKAIKGLQEIAETENGTVAIFASGILIDDDEATADWLESLKDKGYTAVTMESLEEQAAE
ncbi:MAG: hypothetical protein IJN82_07215 [Clostridia bacterium]|nr:hypothetical protein [Clostridia bacterium]